MKKKLSVNGNSWVLYINKSFADAMGITADNRSVSLKFKDRVLYINLNENNNNLLVKKTIKRGAGYGLVMSIPFLELLNVNPEKDSVSINLDEKTLIVQKYS